jgi:hypothetical protein
MAGGISKAFDQNIIALVWDFDKTLINDYMQAPLFDMYGMDPKTFWQEVDGLKDYYAKFGIRVNRDTIYLNHILTYVKRGLFPGLNNKLLGELGKKLSFYPGLPEFFPHLKALIGDDPKYRAFDIRVEHYIVSTGFAETIRNSVIAPFVEGVWGCEFIETVAPPGYLRGIAADPIEEPVLDQVAMALDNTSKTRFLFEINKGANKVNHIDVNSRMSAMDRRVPFSQMMYIADGPSDVPAFSILNLAGGQTYAIYPPRDIKAFKQVDSLRKDGRIQMFGEADYSEGSQTYIWLTEHVREMAENIVNGKERLIRESVSAPPRHI